jgi:hypothetical protein
MDDHGVVSVDAEHADLEQVATAGGTDAHHEIVIESPLRDGIADGGSMSSSAMSCFRAVCPMRTMTR